MPKLYLMTFKYSTIILLASIALFLASCGPVIYTKVREPYQPLHSHEEVRFYGLKETVPDSTVVIGTIKIGDSGFTTDCSWNTVLEKAKTEARKMGGNGLKLTSHLLPTVMGSTCHRITADVLKLKNLPEPVAVQAAPPVNEPVPAPDVVPAPVPAQPAPAHVVAPPRPQSQRDLKKLLSVRKNFRISVQGGFSYMTAATSSSVPSFMKSYIDELKSGGHWGASAAYFFTENLGAGVRYSQFHTQNTFNGQIVVTNTMTGMSRIGGMSDDVTVNFVGPEFYSRFYTGNNKFCFLFSLAFGYLDYKNEAMVIDRYTFTGNTLGYGMHAGVDYVFDKNIGLGIAVSTCNGALSSMQRDDGVTKQTITFRSGEYENVSRIDISGGLRFYF